MANTFTTVPTPFQNMSFTPDIPSQALGPNEYNSGQNIQTNVRGIENVLGDQTILSTIPGTQLFVTANFRANDVWWFIVATLEGYWYGIDAAGITSVLNPGGTAFTYTKNTHITESWNGTTLIVNDGVNAPMFLAPDATQFVAWSQYGQDNPTTGASGTGTVATLTFAATATIQYPVGSTIQVRNVVPLGYNGYYTVTACTTTSVSYLNTTTGAQTTSGIINPYYNWNYTPGWTSSTAGFMRMYCTPNVGSIMVAGNITANLSNGTTVNYPTTVQWSQAFGLDGLPNSWEPTITNVANQLEIPVRGPVVDGFPCAGNFYCCSYWDTVVFSPINYTSTSAPVLGVRLLNQGRGLLNENCWAAIDQVVYGMDARDFWTFDGSSFQSLGNQKIKDWFFGYGQYEGNGQLNPTYSYLTFMINNTSLNQVEIYYPSPASTGWCDQMISYRYDLNIWNPPRAVTNASFACESPRWSGTTPNYATRGIVYSQAGATNLKLVQKDIGTTFLGNQPITTQFRKDNITFGQPYSNQVMTHRILPQVQGTGNVNITVGGALSVGQTPVFQSTVAMPVNTSNPWIQTGQNNYRVTSVEISGDGTTTSSWNMTGIQWQITQVEDSR